MQLSLSGSPTARLQGGGATPLAAHDAALLAWLALEGPTPRKRLIQLLWPDSDPEAARLSLRQRLFRLKKQLGSAPVTGTETLALAAGVGHDLDETSGVLGDAAPALGDEYLAWLKQQRQRRGARAVLLLAGRAERAEQAHDWPLALALAADLLALEPVSEDAHRRLMRLHYLRGDPAAALLVFDRCEQVLKNEVGTRPSAETLELLRTIESAGAAEAAPGRAGPRTDRVPVGVLHPPRLIGREVQLAAMRAGWDGGDVVALIGEAGIGKSRLLQAFAHEWPGSVVSVSARPGDASVPFATLARLLAALQGDAAGPRQAAPEGDDARAAWQGAVRDLLRGSTGGVCVGIAVDDLHFADSASIDVLRALIDDAAPANAGPVTGPSPRWLLACRPAETDSSVRALHDGLVERARLCTVLLPPLDEASLAALVDSLALPGVDGALLAAGLLRRTGGNPLFVLETLKQAWVERALHRLSEAMPRPTSVLRLIERRLTQLSAPALMLARCAAVAGQAFSTALAVRVLGVPALGLADAWSELEQAQVMREEAFAHDLYFEAALASVPAAIARHLHGEVAGWLESAPERAAPPATLARHWLAAQRADRALPYLAQAAEAALRALDPVLAADFFAQLASARSASGDHDGAFAAAQEAVKAARMQGSGAALETAIDRLAALAGTSRQRAAAFEARGLMHHLRGDVDDATEWVARGLAELGSDPEAPGRVDLLNLQGIVLRRAGHLEEARSVLDSALVLARAGVEKGLPADLPAVLNNLALVLQEMDDYVGASELLGESERLQTDPLVRARVLNNLGIALEERGQLAQAYEQRLVGARLCAASISPGVADLVLAVSLGANARNLAQFRNAMAHLAHAEQLSAQVRHWREEDLHRQYAAIWLDLGRPNLARESLDRADHAGAKTPFSGSMVALIRARYLMTVGQDPAAMLAAAEASLRQSADHRTLRRLLICKAQIQPPEAARRSMIEVIEMLVRRGNAGATIPARVRLAQALLHSGRSAEAVLEAQRAADALASASPLDMSCGEVWLTLALSLQAADRLAEAAAAASTGKLWLDHVLKDHLDAEWHDGYLHRNKVNAELLALLPRLLPSR